ncbi:MAG TPA: type IV pilin-like G/H family protein [Oscillatoriales cyanobacterium M59_W2019_021]|nr:type IV pilin-like G/H family protein [Oscillatoriales cyanobacterium M59_W2019_021]
MKTEFKTKFLQHLNQKKKDGGFTLIELLVVIIIIGILAAIALPSFLNQAAKAKQAEGKNNVGAVNRAQQAYRLDNPAYAKTFKDLEIGIPEKGNNYKFEIPDATTDEAVVTATPFDTASLRAFAGKVQIKDGQSLAAACQTPDPSGTPPTIGQVTGDQEKDCNGPDKVMK